MLVEEAQRVNWVVWLPWIPLMTWQCFPANFAFYLGFGSGHIQCFRLRRVSTGPDLSTENDAFRQDRTCRRKTTRFDRTGPVDGKRRFRQDRICRRKTTRFEKLIPRFHLLFNWSNMVTILTLEMPRAFLGLRWRFWMISGPKDVNIVLKRMLVELIPDSFDQTKVYRQTSNISCTLVGNELLMFEI